MQNYLNGRIPETLMVELDRGVDKYGVWKHLAPPGTAARLKQLAKLSYEKYRVTLRPTPGWNVYRPYRIQELYRADLGIWAAPAGWSSHGGVYGGQPCMAADIGNWAQLAPGNPTIAWSRFVALCRIVGLRVDFVTPREQWHVGDFNPWVLPTYTAIRIKPLPVTPEETDMPLRARSTKTGNWYVIGEFTYTRILAGTTGSANHNRAKAYSVVTGVPFEEATPTQIISLLDDMRARLASFLRSIGQSASIKEMQADIDSLIAAEG